MGKNAGKGQGNGAEQPRIELRLSGDQEAAAATLRLVQQIQLRLVQQVQLRLVQQIQLRPVQQNQLRLVQQIQLRLDGARERAPCVRWGARGSTCVRGCLERGQGRGRRVQEVKEYPEGNWGVDDGMPVQGLDLLHHVV